MDCNILQPLRTTLFLGVGFIAIILLNVSIWSVVISIPLYIISMVSKTQDKCRRYGKKLFWMGVKLGVLTIVCLIALLVIVALGTMIIYRAVCAS